MNGGVLPDRARVPRAATASDDRGWRLLPDHAIVMHPGPMNRGMEIAAEVADSPHRLCCEQVTNGVHVRMAVLYTCWSVRTRGERMTRRMQA